MGDSSGRVGAGGGGTAGQAAGDRAALAPRPLRAEPTKDSWEPGGHRTQGTAALVKGIYGQRVLSSICCRLSLSKGG